MSRQSSVPAGLIAWLSLESRSNEAEPEAVRNRAFGAGPTFRMDEERARAYGLSAAGEQIALPASQPEPISASAKGKGS